MSTSASDTPDPAVGKNLSFVVAVPGSPGSSTYGYVLRLGAMDTVVEDAVDTSVSPMTGASDGWPTDFGAVLYAKDVFTIIAPNVTTISQSKTNWISDNLSVTTDPSVWNAVQTANYTTGGVQMSYTSEIQSSFTNGTATNSVAGVSTTIIAGVNSYSIGGLSLTATSGISAQVLTGIGITINNGDSVIATRNGTMSVSTSTSQNAADTIELLAGSPAALAAQSAINVASGVLQVANLVVQGITAANALATGVALDFEGQDLASNADKVRAIIKAQGTAANAAAGVMLVAQMVAIVAASQANEALKVAGGTTAISGLTLSPSQVKLKYGTASISMGLGSLPAPSYDADVETAAATLAAAPTSMDAFANSGNVFDLLADKSPQEEAAELALETAIAARLSAAAAAALLPTLTIESADVVVNAVTNLSLRAAGSLTISVGNSAIEITPESISIASPSVTIFSDSFKGDAPLIDFVS